MLPRLDRALLDALPWAGRYCWETVHRPRAPIPIARVGLAAPPAPPVTCNLHLALPLPIRPFADTMGL
ncbi:MAG: hypothetical protein V9H69_07320 [Anaerolineae bacterium]